MSDHDEKTAATPFAAATSGWPGGWYVYENGKVDGPFSAEETFKLASETAAGKPRLVSRKGFTQWYALKDLSEIFRMTDTMGRQAAKHAEITEAQLQALQKAAPTPPVAAPVKTAPAAAAQPVGVKQVSGKKIKVASSEVAKPVIGGAAAKYADDVKKGPEKAVVAAAPASVPDTPIAPEIPRTIKSEKIAESASKAQMMQEYFLARGRLRLGKLRNPWISAFVGFPLTIGTLWLFWMRDLAKEITFHAHGSDKAPMPPLVLAAIPVLHMYMAFRLAKLMVDMEGQNRYRSVSPWVAALFAIFPPFAIAYLQDAANRHWLLHVKHAMVKKRSE